MQGKDDMNPRTCIVTRQEKSIDELVRFVVGPDGTVVPDVKSVLPGRGAWVSLNKSSVEQAVSKNLFARAFGRKVETDKNLPDLVGSILENLAVGSLAMAKKAGLVVTGFAKVDATVRNGEAVLLLHVSDAAEDGKRKLQSAISATVALGGPETPVMNILDASQLEKALGNNSVVHLAVKHGGAADSLTGNLKRLEQYCSNTTDQ